MAVNGASHVQIRETGNSYLELSETYYRQGATIRQAVQAAIEETDKMGRYLWMAVTPDKYELPICVEDSAQALAERLNIERATVFSAVCKKLAGKNCGRKIIKIRVDE